MSYQDRDRARLIRRQSFETRYGTAQLVFGVIYAFVTAAGMVMAWYVLQGTGRHPLMQYFFTVLFGVLAAKSFYIFFRDRRLFKTAVKTLGKVEEIRASHGITTVCGTITLGSGEELLFESKFAGETLARELKRWLKDTGLTRLPALLTGREGGARKGMFLIKTSAGHLDEDKLKEELNSPEFRPHSGHTGDPAGTAAAAATAPLQPQPDAAGSTAAGPAAESKKESRQENEEDDARQTEQPSARDATDAAANGEKHS